MSNALILVIKRAPAAVEFTSVITLEWARRPRAVGFFLNK